MRCMNGQYISGCILGHQRGQTIWFLFPVSKCHGLEDHGNAKQRNVILPRCHHCARSHDALGFYKIEMFTWKQNSCLLRSRVLLPVLSLLGLAIDNLQSCMHCFITLLINTSCPRVGSSWKIPQAGMIVYAFGGQRLLYQRWYKEIYKFNNMQVHWTFTDCICVGSGRRKTLSLAVFCPLWMS